MAILLLLAWPPRALAHAALIGSDPAAGALLADAPREVTLRFNEPVSPLVLMLVRPDESTVSLAQAGASAKGAQGSVGEGVQAIENGLRVLLPVQDDQGTYAISWRVVSADGHPVGGTLAFSVGAAGGSAQTDVAGQRQLSRNAVIWLLRFAWYVGLFVGIGTVAFHALHGTRPGRGSSVLLLLSLPLSALSLGLLGVDALDLSFSGLWRWDVWLAAARTSYGLAIALTLSGLACAGLALRASSALVLRLLAVMAMGLAGLALASSGHASSASPTWLARPAVLVHGLAIMLWIGALWPLSRASGRDGDPGLLRRFSARIPIVLAALLISGAVLICLQFDQLASLWQTAYGRVLCFKLVLVMTLFGLGALNRYRLTSDVLAGRADARNTMRRVIRTELAVALLILAVVALWRFTPPPRSLQAVGSPPSVTAHIHTEQGMADVSLTPAHAGSSASLTVFLSAPDLSPMQAQQVDIALSNPEAGIEPLSFAATLAEDGTWRVGAMNLPGSPRWNLRIDALVSDFDRVSLSTTLALP